MCGVLVFFGFYVYFRREKNYGYERVYEQIGMDGFGFKNYGYERVYEQIGMDGFGFGHSSRIRGG